MAVWKFRNISTTRHPINFMFGSRVRVRFSGTADQTAPFLLKTT